MDYKKLRNKYLHINPYQRQILSLTLIPVIVLCVLFSLLIAIAHRNMIDALLCGKLVDNVDVINRWAVIIISSFWGFLIFTILWSLSVSCNLVGAFIRIIKELDKFLAGQKINDITARKEDHLANELLQRINAIVKKASSK
jgi:hypothetical protein